MSNDNNSLVRSNLELSFELGSLKSLVQEIAEVVMLLLDTSGSMATLINQPGEPRKRSIDALREVVREIKSQGHVPMIAFGGPYDAQVRFVDDVPEPDGGTPLHLAIPLAKQYGATRLVVISDGLPDLTEQSMIEAKQFGGRIDVVFCGAGGEDALYGTIGARFLEELAKATGGERLIGNFREAKQLSSAVIGLLTGDVDEAAAATIIQGPGFTTVDPPAEPEPAVEDEEDEDEDEEEDDDDDQ